MKFIKIVFPLGICGILFLSACEEESSEDVNQQRVETRYTLLFDVDEGPSGATFGIATFLFGSTPLSLDGSSSVSFEGNEMPFIDLTNWHQTKIDGLIEEGTFVYTNNDGEVFTNTVSLDNSIAFPDTLMGMDISRNESFTVTWIGPALEADETVTLFINDSQLLSADLQLEGSPGATSITVPAAEMTNLAVGTARLNLDRIKVKEIVETLEEGGQATSIYRAAEVTINLVN